MKELLSVEKTIIKTYRKEIWSKFTKAIKDFNLIKENDSIAVCISGGKDSFILAKCLQEIKKHGKINFDLHFISMNPGYNNKVLSSIKNNCKLLNIPIELFNSDIYPYVSSVKTGSPCYLCARMRRGYLYDYAKKIGCNKIALGHHFDDVIETTLLSIFYNGEVKTMLPKLHSTNFKGMELIRPLYYVKEKDIIKWKDLNNLSFIHCECPLSEKGLDSKRQEIKELIETLRNNNRYIDQNILKCTEKINLDTILGYTQNNEYHSFLDNYEDENV